MNTRNLHYFPVNLALMLVFSLMCALPFTSFYFFGVEKSQPVLGTKSTVVNNVTLNQQSQINLVEFSYSLLPFEEFPKGNFWYFIPCTPLIPFSLNIVLRLGSKI